MQRSVGRAVFWGLLATAVLAVLIVVGSRNLQHFDATLVAYTFATLFAAFGITYRYAMWLQRPPTRLYWKRGWQVFFDRRFLGGNLRQLLRRAVVEFAGNRFIFRRARLRGAAHWACHEGFFDLATGRNVSGPPARPLPRIVLEIDRGEIWATGVEERTV